MPSLPDLEPPVPPLVIAALLLLARTYLRLLSLPCPTAAEILGSTQASKSRAYEIVATLQKLLPSLVGTPGRPRSVPPAPAPEQINGITLVVLRFVMTHPGCVGPRFYADTFRRMILDLREDHQKLDLGVFAKAVGVPKGTLEDWLRVKRVLSEDSERAINDSNCDARSAHIESIISAWKKWHGTFSGFCNHVLHHLRLDYGRVFVAQILHTYGERNPKRRGGRSPDEVATRDSFEVFFPGAQWVGDGMSVPVEVNDERFTFNLELDVDAYSGAIVGASIRDEEDSQAVVEAFGDGVTTTGTPPLALLLDNRPSNHTPEVDQTLGDTLRMKSTPGRGQSKAHVEGAFGLFSQDAPPLAVWARTPHELARAILRLRVQTWGRTLNHRPRTDRQGRSRIDIYREASPTDEQIAQAKQALEERMKLLEKARTTQEARTDPIVRDALDQAFIRLGLDDPEQRIRLAIAGYPRDAVLDGIAVFEGKKRAGTLPDGVDGRYMLGIVKNISHVHESDAITEALIRERLAARDILLSGLRREREDLMRSANEPSLRLQSFIDRAMVADRAIDRFFWLASAGETITDQPELEHKPLFKAAARRIHCTFAAHREARYTAERVLARHVWPVS